MKRIIGVLCSLVVMLSFVIPTASASANGNDKGNTNGNEKMVQVVLYDDGEQVIISEVPKFYEQQYLRKLKDPDFRNAEIQNSTGGNVQSDTISLMATSYVKYYLKSDVIRMVDYLDNQFNWAYYISNPLTDFMVGKAVAVIFKSNFIGTAIAATAWTAADLSNRQSAWWKDSAYMILKKQITGVKLTVTPGPPSGYPAAYVILSRF